MTIDEIMYRRSTHAPLLKVYHNGEFRSVPGEQGDLGWVIDPETGAEYHALGGHDHRYLKDWKIGPSYGVTTFVWGRRPDGSIPSGDELEEFLREHGMWSDRLTDVLLPYDGMDFLPAFQFRPPEVAPSIKRCKTPDGWNRSEGRYVLRSFPYGR